MRKIEVCSTSVHDALEALKGGAVRIELCSAIGCGGVTPSYGLITNVMSAVGGCEGFDVNVLIRPREGSFCYNEDEILEMISDILSCKAAGVDGVVIGALTPDGDIDMCACRRLVEAAVGMNITFHRAFDVCRNPETALEQIISLGCDHLLTSGQCPKAMSGADLIASLVKQASGRIVVMPGSGVNPANIVELERVTGASEFHSTARKAVMEMSLRNVPELGFDEPSAGPGMVMRTSADVVRELVGND